ncbi:hypothetical protein [Streptomonospora litoralis]|nr:hypothetical protein [Streptomonospora litoralis]
MAWDIRAFQIEPGVVAFRHEILPSHRAGARTITAATWDRLAQLLDKAERFDADCHARIASSRARAATRADEMAVPA